VLIKPLGTVGLENAVGRIAVMDANLQYFRSGSWEPVETALDDWPIGTLQILPISRPDHLSQNIALNRMSLGLLACRRQGRHASAHGRGQLGYCRRHRQAEKKRPPAAGMGRIR
jgi:hypothetical protein